MARRSTPWIRERTRTKPQPKNGTSRETRGETPPSPPTHILWTGGGSYFLVCAVIFPTATLISRVRPPSRPNTFAAGDNDHRLCLCLRNQPPCCWAGTSLRACPTRAARGAPISRESAHTARELFFSEPAKQTHRLPLLLGCLAEGASTETRLVYLPVSASSLCSSRLPVRAWRKTSKLKGRHTCELRDLRERSGVFLLFRFELNVHARPCHSKEKRREARRGRDNRGVSCGCALLSTHKLSPAPGAPRRFCFRVHQDGRERQEK